MPDDEPFPTTLFLQRFGPLAAGLGGWFVFVVYDQYENFMPNIPAKDIQLWEQNNYITTVRRLDNGKEKNFPDVVFGFTKGVGTDANGEIADAPVGFSTYSAINTYLIPGNPSSFRFTSVCNHRYYIVYKGVTIDSATTTWTQTIVQIGRWNNGAPSVDTVTVDAVPYHP